MPSVVSSAAGLLTLLEEPNDELQKYALAKLNGVVHDYWFEVRPGREHTAGEGAHTARGAPPCGGRCARARMPTFARPCGPPQISPSIAAVEALYEDEGFKDRELAALIASKVRACGRAPRMRARPPLHAPPCRLPRRNACTAEAAACRQTWSSTRSAPPHGLGLQTPLPPSPPAPPGVLPPRGAGLCPHLRPGRGRPLRPRRGLGVCPNPRG